MKYFSLLFFSLLIILFGACSETKSNSHTLLMKDSVQDAKTSFQASLAPSLNTIAINSSLIVSFTQPLDESTINSENISIKNENNETIAVTLVLEGLKLKITPNTLLNINKKYTLLLSADIKNSKGTLLKEEYKYSFTTASEDTTPPAIKTLLPLAKNVDVATNIIVEFNDLLDTTKIQADSLQLKDSNNSVVDGSFEYAQQWLWFTPSQDLKNDENYTLDLMHPIYDLSENELNATQLLSFQTASTSLHSDGFVKVNDDLNLGDTTYSLEVENNTTLYVGAENKISKVSTQREDGIPNFTTLESKESSELGVVYAIGSLKNSGSCSAYNALVLATSKGVSIVSKSDLSTISSLPLSAPSYGVDVVCNESNNKIYAYVANSIDGIQIIDVTDQSNINKVELFSTKGVLFDILYANGKIYTASYTEGVNVYNLSGELLQHFNTSSTSRSLLLDENRLIVSDGVAGIEKYSMTTDGTLSASESLPSLSTVINAYATSENIFAITTTKGISVIEKNDTSHISYQIPNAKRFIAMGGDNEFLYTLTLDGVLSAYNLHSTQEDGKAVDGYLSGATVFKDCNNNGTLEESIDTYTKADENGTYSFKATPYSCKDAFLLVTGGIDKDTGVTFKGVLKAKSGSNNISPITSLIIGNPTVETKLLNSLNLQSIDDDFTVSKNANAMKLSLSISNILTLFSDLTETTSNPEITTKAMETFSEAIDANVTILENSETMSDSFSHIASDIFDALLAGDFNTTFSSSDKEAFMKSIKDMLDTIQMNVSDLGDVNGSAILFEVEKSQDILSHFNTDANQSDNNSTLDSNVTSEANSTTNDSNSSSDGESTTPSNQNAPQFTSSNNVSVYENQIEVLTLSATDADDDALTFSLKSNATDETESFDINGSRIIFKIPPDYEEVNNYNLSVLVSDGAHSVEQSIEVAILNIAETVPVLQDFNATIAENIEHGNFIGNIIVESGDSAITDINLSGEGSENFTTDTTGKVFVSADASFDYESKTLYNLTAIATNEAGSSRSVHILINISDYTNPFLTAKIFANDGRYGDYFGQVSAVDGDYIVVGAHGVDNYAGAAYIYKKQKDGSAIQIAKIQASDVEEYDYFGKSVSIAGDYIVVGAQSEDTTAKDAGSVYIFKRNSDTNVTQIAKIQASDAEEYDYFGDSVSIAGDYIAVGAYREDTTESNAGSVYIFKRNSDTNVTQIAKIQASDAEANDFFGYPLSIDGDYVVVGAQNEDTTATAAGSVYIFKRDSDTNVTQIAKIQASDAEESDYFGHSISIAGDYIAVGAYKEDTTAKDAGSAYIFKRDSDTNITQIAKLQASDPESSDYFGSSVSIAGDYIVVGAYHEDTVGINAGSAYVFKRNSDKANDTTQIAKIQANDTEKSDYFGTSVAISGDNVVITKSEGAYLFDIEPSQYIYTYDHLSSVKYNETLLHSSISLDVATPSGDAITFATTGVDGDKFSFSDVNLSFLNIADFENPADDNADNNYTIAIVATDEHEHTKEIESNIELQDKKYLEMAKIQANDAESNDNFGYSVSINGDYIVVGAYNEDTTANGAGSAYIFKRNSNSTDDVTQIAKIQANDAESNDNFGQSVSIDGDYIVVGAKFEDTTAGGAGSAYVFKRSSDTNVTQIAKIQANDAESNDNFGQSVSINGDYIVVGANYEDTTANGAGSAYIFKRNSDTNVTQIAKIQASDAEASDLFGQSVSIDGDYIVVGAYREDTTANDAGSAYIFKRNSDDINDTTQISKIQANDAEASDYFGSSVSIAGDYIVVGAYQEDTVGSSAGSAYVFKRNSDKANDTTQIAKIQANDAESNDNFGYSVSIDGNYIVVGARNKNKSEGNAYIFQKNLEDNITQIDKLYMPDGKSYSFFGSSVAISGDSIVSSVPSENTTGRAHLFIKDSNQAEE